MGILYDLLGSTIVGGLLMLTVLKLNASVVESTYNGTQNLVIQQEASLVEEILDRDLMNIGYGDTAKSHILSATPHSLVFRIDVDRNGSVDTVAYYYTNGSNVDETLSRWGYPPRSLPVDPNDSVIFRLSTASEGDPIGTPKLLTSRASSFSISYFDSRNTTVQPDSATVDSIRYVSIGMKISDVRIAYDLKKAVLDWYKTYRPKNL